MVLYKMMVILTYPACWDQQRQRRGPCPGEPLEETKISLRQLKSDHIHKEEAALSLKATQRDPKSALLRKEETKSRASYSSGNAPCPHILLHLAQSCDSGGLRALRG